jgi:tyrosyl-tRNA synthetase
VHSPEALQAAIRTSEFLFGNGTIDFLSAMSDEALLDVFEGVPHFHFSKAELEQGIAATDLLGDKTKVFPSKGEARKMIQGGGVSINREKIADPAITITADRLLNGKYLVAQKGKKNYFLLIGE